MKYLVAKEVKAEENEAVNMDKGEVKEDVNNNKASLQALKMEIYYLSIFSHLEQSLQQLKDPAGYEQNTSRGNIGLSVHDSPSLKID